MNRSAYKQYLASREWALLREAVRDRSYGRCERCWSGQHEQTHHLTYERIGQETLEDLLAVCSPCHEYLSGQRHDDPMWRADLNLLHIPTIPKALEAALRLRVGDRICMCCRDVHVPAAYALWTRVGFQAICRTCLLALAGTLCVAMGSDAIASCHPAPDLYAPNPDS